MQHLPVRPGIDKFSQPAFVKTMAARLFRCQILSQGWGVTRPRSSIFFEHLR
jgi:hypothetical protein